ncbi:MAG: hypothetical protein WC736_15075 [Gallionella sp.]|jgi:hypothetical protein
MHNDNIAYLAQVREALRALVYVITSNPAPELQRASLQYVNSELSKIATAVMKAKVV